MANDVDNFIAQTRLTEEDISILNKALDAYEAATFQSGMTSSLLTLMFSKDNEEGKAKAEETMDKAKDEGEKRRKELLPLRFKLHLLSQQ